MITLASSPLDYLPQQRLQANTKFWRWFYEQWKQFQWKVPEQKPSFSCNCCSGPILAFLIPKKENKLKKRGTQGSTVDLHHSWHRLLDSSVKISGGFFFFFFFLLFKVAPVAYGSSWARGQIRAAPAGLGHSHSNAISEPRLRPIPQLMATLDSQPTEQGQELNQYLTSWIQAGFVTAEPQWDLQTSGGFSWGQTKMGVSHCFWVINLQTSAKARWM